MCSKVLEWAQATFDSTYQNAKAESSALATYKTSEKRIWVTERQDLITLYSNVQTKVKTYGLRPWVPAPELSPQVCTQVVCLGVGGRRLTGARFAMGGVGCGGSGAVEKDQR
jgi:hypothetical protein